MSHFLPAFDRTMLLEGGLQLTEIADDNGGQTYAGLSRRANPLWDGWRFIDRGEVPPIELVRNAYRVGYWNPIWGDEISDQATAESIYDFAVNAGPKVAIRCAQAVLGVKTDGVMGNVTMAALNECEEFHMAYTVAKINHYAGIVNKNRSQGRFLLGWVNRALKVAA